MRFKTGSKVEVLKQVEVLTAWCGAEIVSGNGHTYSVRYDCYISEHGVGTERVPRKLIRPPPPVQRVESWVAGDVVEVFDDVMWRIAIISRVYGAYCMVRPLGSSYKFKVHISHIRIRHCWENDTWIVMDKGLGISEDQKFSQLSSSDCFEKRSFQAAQTSGAVKRQQNDDFLAAQSYTGLLGSYLASSRTLKRASPYCSSLIQANSRHVKKIRAAENVGRSHQVLPVCVDQVDAVDYRKENFGKMYMHVSFNNKTNGYNISNRGELHDFNGYALARGSESNDSDSDICSVGSCSAVPRSLNEFSTHMPAVSSKKTNSISSDAESYCGSREDEGCSVPPEDGRGASIHNLELDAYRRTLVELYASGPLSWEKEGMLTNLRITLHVSNDEHLMEVKNLISGGNNNMC